MESSPLGNKRECFSPAQQVVEARAGAGLVRSEREIVRECERERAASATPLDVTSTRCKQPGNEPSPLTAQWVGRRGSAHALAVGISVILCQSCQRLFSAGHVGAAETERDNFYSLQDSPTPGERERERERDRERDKRERFSLRQT
ncbi:hypothetical protein FQN60_005906 [Etheostoma spectabile]|uniref:Uncharacterized protein n=1 Tax=Etheostoma spectabile TaxID=54343 RepID=A0A5J5CJR6_9PERO|nr:hypothetical protein FQN60_005906 [Etheostoma spectabile]